MIISDTTVGTDGKSRKEFLLTKNCNSCWNIYHIEIVTINFHVLLLSFFLSYNIHPGVARHPWWRAR